MNSEILNRIVGSLIHLILKGNSLFSSYLQIWDEGHWNVSAADSSWSWSGEPAAVWIGKRSRPYQRRSLQSVDSLSLELRIYLRGSMRGLDLGLFELE